MGTFTIFQTGLIANSYFIPNSDGCNIDLIPVGVVINWDCINDPRDIPDEDYTYVYSSVTDLQYDLYRIPNHTTESGIINFVRIFARAKSADITQHQDGIYKIILTDNACGNIYKSDDIDLITSYSTYNNVWTTNPRTTDAWTWTDIDNLQFGIECSSPSVATTTNSVFRPNATGFHTNMDYSNEGAATTWECVNEASPDEDTTYIRQNVGARYAPISFNLNNPTTEAGAINYVSIFARGKRTSGLANMRSLIRLAGTDKTGTTNTMGSGYVTYSDIHPLTPADDAWTWADISNLEAGVSIYVSAPAGARVTQIYVLVNYNILVNPEIRTTQTYLQVNYTVPSCECEVRKPGDKINGGEVSTCGFFTFDMTARMNQTVNYPGDLAKLLLNGAVEGETYKLDGIGADISVFDEVSLGWSGSILDNLQVGVRAKMLFGIGDIYTSRSELSVTTSQEAWNIQSDLMVRASLPSLAIET